jgi:hypothetical protein
MIAAREPIQTWLSVGSPREQFSDRGNRIVEPLVCVPADGDIVKSHLFQLSMEERLHFISAVSSITNTIGYPRNIYSKQKVQIACALSRLLNDPWRTLAEVMFTVDNRTQQIRVEEDKFTSSTDRSVFACHLAVGNGAVIFKIESPASLLCVMAYEFFGDRYAEILAESVRKLCFTGGF